MEDETGKEPVGGECEGDICRLCEIECCEDQLDTCIRQSMTGAGPAFLLEKK